jgi:hypothetical protein
LLFASFHHDCARGGRDGSLHILLTLSFFIFLGFSLLLLSSALVPCQQTLPGEFG